MVEDGHVTEGTSNNAYIVKGNKIITRHLGNEILHGITRAAVLRFAREAQMPVVEIDGAAVGAGKPGHIAARLREIYLDESRKMAI